MTIEKWLKLAKKQIAALDAELIVLYGLKQALPLGADRSFLFLHPEMAISQENWRKLDKMLERRAAGEPLAYILGFREFFGRNFVVNSAVLIPRPETESLVEMALELIRGAESDRGAREPWEGGLSEERLKKAENGRKWRILEVGTGSGCIAVTLALELETEVEVVATDISPAALTVARENAANLGAKVRFLRSDLFKEVEKTENVADFDILLANLPYVDSEWEWISQKSLDFEPQEALYAAGKGLALYDGLFEQLAQFGVPRHLIIEADPCQHEILIEKAAKIGYKSREKRGFGLRFES